MNTIKFICTHNHCFSITKARPELLQAHSAKDCLDLRSGNAQETQLRCTGSNSMALTALVAIFSVTVPVVSARRRAQRGAAKDISEGLVVLGCVAAFVLAVPILLTAWRMYHDPITPHLLHVMKQAVKDYFSSAAQKRVKHKVLTSRELAAQGYVRRSLQQPDSTLRHRPRATGI